uniref:Uncharacterized protein n=1 Tax=Anguilla anguilla TaxID=7936 RepID=A0A0E9S0T0_ANGAN
MQQPVISVMQVILNFDDYMTINVFYLFFCFIF